MARPLVIQTEHLDPAAADWLRERCEVVNLPWQDRAALDRALPNADALLIRTYTTVDRALLDKAPRLRAVARAGVGLDNVDQAACAARGIAVLSTPGANTRAVVELVTACILDTLRPRTRLDRALDGPAWSTLRADLIAPHQLSDLTLGLIGLGRVGSSVARVAAAFDTRTIYTDLLDIPTDRRHGAAPVSLDQLLTQSDIVSVHVDGRPENRHLINAAALARCKPSVLLLNTSRGFVIAPDALAAFLRSNPGAHATLDVHDPEPFGPDYPLLNLPNARLLPHIGAATKTAHANMSWVVKDLWEALST